MPVAVIEIAIGSAAGVRMAARDGNSASATALANLLWLPTLAVGAGGATLAFVPAAAAAARARPHASWGLAALHAAGETHAAAPCFAGPSAGDGYSEC